MSEVVDLIQARVVGTLRWALPEVQRIAGESRLADELGLDSLALMELILALEDRFDISIPLERVARASTVDDLVDTIKTLLVHRRESLHRSNEPAAGLQRGHTQSA